MQSSIVNTIATLRAHCFYNFFRSVVNIKFLSPVAFVRLKTYTLEHKLINLREE